MKKEFDMSDLVENLTSEPEVETGRRVRTGSKAKKQMEGIALKDIFAAGLNMAISNYEQKNGEIRVKKAKRGNANAVFGMEDEA